MSDLSTREEVRAEAIAKVAEAEYLHWAKNRANESTWADCSDPSWRQRFIDQAARAVDALGDLLPTGIEYRWVYEPDGTPLGYRERQLLTGWQDAAVSCSGCGVTERDCGRWRGGTPCCPECRHPTREMTE